MSLWYVIKVASSSPVHCKSVFELLFGVLWLCAVNRDLQVCF